MITTTTFRQFNGSVYVRIPPTFAEYYSLKKQIESAQTNETEPKCKIEDQDTNKLLVIFKKW